MGQQQDRVTLLSFPSPGRSVWWGGRPGLGSLQGCEDAEAAGGMPEKLGLREINQGQYCMAAGEPDPHFTAGDQGQTGKGFAQDHSVRAGCTGVGSRPGFLHTALKTVPL